VGARGSRGAAGGGACCLCKKSIREAVVGAVVC
jgi:hypothetical protein